MGGWRVGSVSCGIQKWKMSYDPHEKKSHFLLIMVFISVLAKMYAHFSLEIYIFKDELRHALPFLHFFHIKMR